MSHQEIKNNLAVDTVARKSASTSSSSFLTQDRFQVAVCLALAVYKARSSYAQEAPFSALSLLMDTIALFVMYLMYKERIPSSVSSLVICITVNSLKSVSHPHNVSLYVFVALCASMLIMLVSRSVILPLLAIAPAVIAYLGYLPSPFAVAYLLDSAVGLPLLFLTLPNQFGKKRSVNSLACHALLFLMLGRAFLAGHYLELGLFRKFNGPWDVPLLFRGKDCFASAARSVGFLLHLLQAGFFVKFMLYYIPAFCSSTSFRVPDVGCRLEMFEQQKPPTCTSGAAPVNQSATTSVG